MINYANFALIIYTHSNLSLLFLSKQHIHNIHYIINYII